MNQILGSFSTREIAIANWILIALLACMCSKDIRSSFAGVLKALFAWKISVSLLAFFLHTSLWVFILYRIALWDMSLLKDSIIWALSFGFISLVNINKMKNSSQFKALFLDAVKWTIAIEFVVNFFTFSLLTEMIIVGVAIFSAIMQAFASVDPKHKPVEHLMRNTLLGISVLIFVFSFYKTLEGPSQLLAVNNFKSFFQPVFLSITFLPFMYFYNLLIKYEEIWVRLRFMVNNERERRKVKRHILLVAHIDINKLVAISDNISKSILMSPTFSYERIKQISKGGT